MVTLVTVELANSEPITSSSRGDLYYSFPEDAALRPQEMPAAISATTVVSGLRGHTIDVFLCGKFRELADKWKAETVHISSRTKLENHEAYQKIVGMGQVVIPLVLQELLNDPDWWFMALDALVDNPPTLEGAEGDLIKSSCAWIEWGKSNGYLAAV